MKEKSFISAVVYVRNNEGTIGSFIERLSAFLEDNFDNSEIVCVNDGSSDGSVEEIKQAADKVKETVVSIINMSYFHGLELAMNAGVDMAIGDFVAEFDSCIADYDMSLVMDVYRKVLEGYDVVSAVSDKKERLSSRLFYKLLEKYSDLSIALHTESFRIVSRRMINRIKAMNVTIPYRKIIYASAGLKTTSLSYRAEKLDVSGDRTGKEAGEYRKKLATDSLLLFTAVGDKISMGMTLFMMAVTILMIVYTVTVFLIGKPTEGWTTTVLFFSVAFFGLFAILTIVIKYLQLILGLVFKRKQYNFESIEKLTK